MWLPRIALFDTESHQARMPDAHEPRLELQVPSTPHPVLSRKGSVPTSDLPTYWSVQRSHAVPTVPKAINLPGSPVLVPVLAGAGVSHNPHVGPQISKGTNAWAALQVTCGPFPGAR